MLVEMEMAVRRWRWSAGTRAHTSSPPYPHRHAQVGCAPAPLQVKVGTYPLLLPTRLALAYAPALLDRRFSSSVLGVVRNAQASSCGDTRTHSRTRRDGDARVRREHLFSLTVGLGIPLLMRGRPSMHMRYAGAADIEADVCMCATHSHSRGSSSDRDSGSVHISPGVAVFFLRGYRGRALRGSGYIFGFGCALARR
jgi:hypothetical protein